MEVIKILKFSGKENRGLIKLLYQDPVAFDSRDTLAYSVILHEVAHGWVAYLSATIPPNDRDG